MCICVWIFKILVSFGSLFYCFLGKHHNCSATKYAPPQVRKAQETLDDKKREELGRLKKMVNGLINR